MLPRVEMNIPIVWVIFLHNLVLLTSYILDLHLVMFPFHCDVSYIFWLLDLAVELLFPVVFEPIFMFVFHCWIGLFLCHVW